MTTGARGDTDTPALEHRGADSTTEGRGHAPRRPLYCRMLGIRHLQLRGWQRALFLEGTIVVGALLWLAELASPWTILVLPAVTAAVVKGNDLMAGQAHRRRPGDTSRDG